MIARLIDGKAVASRIKADTASRAQTLAGRGRKPCLSAILIGDNASAESYARSQAKHAEEIGVDYRLTPLPAGTTEAKAIEAINSLNSDPKVHGIILQLPVPSPLDALKLQRQISPDKDVEGVAPANLGLLAMGRKALVPCTAAAAFACLRAHLPDLAGRDAVVVGRSVIVGKPLAMLLLNANATVTQCHTRTKDLAEHTRSAEILVVAAGVPSLIGAEHVAPGTIVIDVGTHRVKLIDSDGVERTRTIGDVRFDEVAQVASAITPVPGGVGPVTVAMLLQNTVEACDRQSHK